MNDNHTSPVIVKTPIKASKVLKQNRRYGIHILGVNHVVFFHSKQRALEWLHDYQWQHIGSLGRLFDLKGAH